MMKLEEASPERIPITKGVENSDNKLRGDIDAKDDQKEAIEMEQKDEQAEMVQNIVEALVSIEIEDALGIVKALNHPRLNEFSH